MTTFSVSCAIILLLLLSFVNTSARGEGVMLSPQTHIPIATSITEGLPVDDHLLLLPARKTSELSLQLQARNIIQTVFSSIQHQINLWTNNVHDSTRWVVETLQRSWDAIFDTGKADIVSQTDGNSLSWAGVPCSGEEQSIIDELRKLVYGSEIESGVPSQDVLHDVELLRFLRASAAGVEGAAGIVRAHSEWRASLSQPEVSEYGEALRSSPLQHELFWLGVNDHDCAVLVLRTQVHDGQYYNDDPQVYSRFVLGVLEEGRRVYGVGIHRQVCLLVDRGGTVLRNGVPRTDSRDMTVIPKILEVVNTVVSAVQANYPDILHSAKIAPASWFFALCYRLVSGALDEITRSKIEFISEQDLVGKLHLYVPAHWLPSHLGGTSEAYESILDIIHSDPAQQHVQTRDGLQEL